jgi:hypothetical protein
MKILDEVPVFITNITLKKGVEGKRKLTDEQAIVVYKSNQRAKVLAVQYNVSVYTIYRIKQNITYKSTTNFAKKEKTK